MMQVNSVSGLSYHNEGVCYGYISLLLLAGLNMKQMTAVLYTIIGNTNVTFRLES